MGSNDYSRRSILQKGIFLSLGLTFFPKVSYSEPQSNFPQDGYELTGIDYNIKSPSHSKQFSLEDYVRNNDLPVLLNFWEPWCGPCLEEMPDLEKIHKRGIARVVGYALDANILFEKEIKPEYVGAKERIAQVTFPLVGPKPGKENMYKAVEYVNSGPFFDKNEEGDVMVRLPTTIIISPDFKIISRVQNMQTYSGFIEEIEKIKKR